MADANVLEPPMPPFRVDDVKINLRSDPFFPWCVKYTRWATIVRPETNLCQISDHVFRIIPSLFRTTLYNIAMNDKYEAEREALEKAQEEGREIAEEHNVQKWSFAKVDAVITKMARQVLAGPQTDEDGGDSDSELPTTGSPPRPPPSRLLNRGKSKEAERWMQDYFRWNLTRDPRLSLLQLSYEISTKTYGVIPATSFHKYRTANKSLFRKIEAQVQRETGLDVAHVTGRRNASSTRTNVRRRSLEELIGSDSESEEPTRVKRLHRDRMRSPV
ncbi:hypothetical protein EXIGLDRAFT_836290 [Exidia glandulosa HHB12029]|uniref:Uncharacterized protein n=1 Tax=Exidia glandulosa HHB12029 TaxID=1314781 RepID=A0A165HZM9_EXIGL|nr:hypothetical protein EXIGLDRAFT_836290 [Exidia glandulosa HHB12029]